MPVEIAVDLPIEVVVQAPEGSREAHLTHITPESYTTGSTTVKAG